MKCITKDDFRELLKTYNLKATDERLFILEILKDVKKPQTAPDILKKTKNLKMHETTLYRILSTFTKKGIIKQIDFKENVARYELLDNEDDHHHIVCTSCKKVTDFVGCDIDKTIKKALSQNKDFKKITNHSFELFGLCKNCA